MTVAERALLLACAETLSMMCEVELMPKTAAALRMLIDKVEADAKANR